MYKRWCDHVIGLVKKNGVPYLTHMPNEDLILKPNYPIIVFNT